MQYKSGTVSVTNGSNTVTFAGNTADATAIAVGNFFKLDIDGDAIYQIASRTPASGATLTSLTLSAVYGGSTGSGLSYQVVKDFSANRGLVQFGQGDADAADWLTKLINQIDADLAVLLGSAARPTLTPGSVLFKGAASVGLAQDNANLFWDNTNKRLGIGTSAPDGRLNIVNQVVGAQGLRLDQGTINAAGIVVYNAAASGVSTLDGFMRVHQAGTAATAAAMVVRQDGSGDILQLLDGVTQVLAVKDGGNVGIGTSSPGAKLDVAGNVLLSGGSPTLTFTSAGPAITLPAANTLAFSTASTERLRIDPSGNVGIGTSAPDGRLNIVNQVVGAQGLRLDQGTINAAGIAVYNAAASGVSTLDGFMRVHQAGTAATAAAMVVRQDGSGDILQLLDGVTQVLAVKDGGILAIGTTVTTGANGGQMVLTKTTAPGVAGANNAILFVRDNGAGKTQLAVQFQSGAVQVLATEP